MAVDFDKEDEIILKKINKLIDKFEAKLLRLVNDFAVKGGLEVNSELAFFDANIFDELKDSGLKEIYNYILSVYSQLNIENIKYYSKITKLSNDIAKSDAVKFVTDNLKKNLIGQEMKANLASRIANSIRPLILSNADYKTVANIIRKQLPEQIRRYTNVITRDAISQYDGAIQNTIKKKYNPSKGYYIGGLIETSRPFCIHVKDKYGTRAIDSKELEADLDEYCPGGIPSKDTIEIDSKRYKKGAGMIEGTTIDTFEFYRGGNNCNHKWRWILT